MLDRPQIDDDDIIACVRATYGLTLTEIEFLPLGYDSNAGVYRARAGADTYFLKVKRDAVDPVSILLPQFLKMQRMEWAVAPLPTTTPDPWGKAGPFALILYPFIEAAGGGWGADLPDSQWIAFGHALRQLHTVQLPPDLLDRMPRETFIPHAKWLPLIKRLHATVMQQEYDHPAQQELAAFWCDHQQDISRIIDRTGQLGRRLQAQPPGSREFVLCHADIHVGNVLIDAQDQLFIVDWDQPILAPRERDLMFVTVGGFVTETRVETLIFQGYGDMVIDPLVMAYYRYERTMQDLADFAHQVFVAESSDETKHDSVRWFMAQFAPGGVIAAAQEHDTG